MSRQHFLDTVRLVVYIINMIRNNEHYPVTDPKDSPLGNRLDELAVFEFQAQVCAALANPKRLQILTLLKNGELSVGRITEALGISKANVSQHLSLLRQQGIVRTRKEGTTVYYSITHRKIIEACTIMRDILIELLKQREAVSRTMRTISEEEM